ncbi:MAG: hypothetical protein U9N13_03535 [Euryarchaeota archaeon]|nr:hypothetical protein [Euryarchaeota archaeon]
MLVACITKEHYSDAVEYLTAKGFDHEVRTTAIREFIGGPDDISMIARTMPPYLNGSHAPYVLQQGIPDHAIQISSVRDTRYFSQWRCYNLLFVLMNIWGTCGSGQKKIVMRRLTSNQFEI